MKLIIDFDNAFNVDKRDVDDFIAFLYLMRERADIVLVTTSFGNASLEEVNQATEKIFKDLGLAYDLALGGRGAAEKIVEKVNEYPGHITILSLGSTTNSAQALEIDGSIGQKANFLAMGTISQDLVINGKIMDELNFSIDHKASIKVLEGFDQISILTANNCLKGYLTLEELEDIFKNEGYLMEEAKDWFDFHSKDYDIGYIIVWDLIAALYFTRPDLFEDDRRKMVLSEPEKGLLEEDPSGKPINMPILKDRQAFARAVHKAFN